MTLTRTFSRLLAVFAVLVVLTIGGLGFEEREIGWEPLLPGAEIGWPIMGIASVLLPAILVAQRRSPSEEGQRQSQPWAGPSPGAGAALLPAGVRLRLPALVDRAPRALVVSRRRGLRARLSRLLRRS